MQKISAFSPRRFSLLRCRWMFFKVPSFQENSSALKNSWLRAWICLYISTNKLINLCNLSLSILEELYYYILIICFSHHAVGIIPDLKWHWIEHLAKQLQGNKLDLFFYQNFKLKQAAVVRMKKVWFLSHEIKREIF